MLARNKGAAANSASVASAGGNSITFGGPSAGKTIKFDDDFPAEAAAGSFGAASAPSVTTEDDDETGAGAAAADADSDMEKSKALR